MKEKINAEKLYLIFVAGISFIIFLLMKLGFLSSFLTALFVYVYLRFCQMLFTLVGKICLHFGIGAPPEGGKRSVRIKEK